MNLNKHSEFFDPRNLGDEIHIIGVGAIGSTVAEMLTRLGCQALHLYDFDKVADYNVTNQMYRALDIGKPKIDALSSILLDINPDLKITLHPEGWGMGSVLTGHVFICVDSIKVRQLIVDNIKYNLSIKSISDYRMRMTDAQHYFAGNREDVDKLRKTMDFTSEEAKEATPVSACGTTLSVTPTVRSIVSSGVANWINFILNKEYKTMILLDAFNHNIVCFPE